MRFVLYGVFLVLWTGMWWWTYTCHIKVDCCPEGFASIKAVRILPDLNETRPVLFRWADPVPVTTSSFGVLTDSLIDVLGDGRRLEVTGLYFRDEVAEEQTPDLGIARALAMRKLLSDRIDTSMITTSSSLRPLAGDVRDAFFTAHAFRSYWWSDRIQEEDDRVMLDLASLADTAAVAPDLRSYLGQLADQLKQGTDTLRIASADAVYGEHVRSYLLNLEVPAERIVIQENSELNIKPTRVEVRIIKHNQD